MNSLNTPTGAIFSPCHNYRYALWRIWKPDQPYILFIGLNPSKADAQRNDPTIRRCIGFAKQWGYGGVYVTNLFSWRTCYPKMLKATPDPIGPETDDWMLHLKKGAHAVVACWGNHGGWGDRHQSVIAMFPQLYCLKLTKQGYPAHPLYLPYTIKPILFQHPVSNSQSS